MSRKSTKPINNQSKNNDGEVKIKKMNGWQETVRFFCSYEFRFIIGLLISILTIYFFVAYVNFFATGRNDFSILELPQTERIGMRQHIQNITGLPGARATFFLIHQCFGLPIVLFYILLLVLSLNMMDIIHVRKWRTASIFIFLLLWLSCFLAFVQKNVLKINSFFEWGGQLGADFNAWLISYIHIIGVVFVLLASFIIFFILVDKRTISFIQRVLFGTYNGIKSVPEKVKRVIPQEAEQISQDINATDDDISLESVPKSVLQEDETLKAAPQEILLQEDEIQQESILQEDKISDEEPQETPQDVVLEVTNEQKKEGTTAPSQEVTPEPVLEPYDPHKDLEFYKYPQLELLKKYDNEELMPLDKAEQQDNANKIMETLRNYGVEIARIKATVGPTVTLYEIVPATGVKIARIQNLESDIMLSLSAIGIRIIAPMPGKGTVGIEVPNTNPQIVSMHSVLASKHFQEEKKMRLPVAIGRTITNDVFMFDLAKTPHLLVAGATGQGKSVGLNAIITSLLYKKHPSELKFVLVDPKMVEFSIYKPLYKQFLAALPNQTEDEIIITDCQKVINTLNSLVDEMENRYTLLMDASVRNLEEYNGKFIDRKLNPAKDIMRADNPNVFHHRFLPYLVIIIDEYGDFIMQAGKEVERPIQRLAQKARAVGMHLILATQRPDVKIVTGTIKANIPTRIAFRTQSMIDSRTVLDAKGADQLIGKGDMLYSGGGELTRIQCAFIDTPEVERVVQFVHNQQGFTTPYELPEPVNGEKVGSGGKNGTFGADFGSGKVITVADDDKNSLADLHLEALFEKMEKGALSKFDDLFVKIAKELAESNVDYTSTSSLQRYYNVGYARAGKITDLLELVKIIGPNEGAKGRRIRIHDFNTLQRIFEVLQKYNLL